MRTVLRRVLFAMAALVFIAPAVAFVATWPRKPPASPTEVDRARVEAVSDGYRVVLPMGATYEFERSKVTGTDKRDYALALVRSQLVEENLAYRQAWAGFWFLLGGACLVAMLLTLAGKLLNRADN